MRRQRGRFNEAAELLRRKHGGHGGQFRMRRVCFNEAAELLRRKLIEVRFFSTQ